ncbi:MAG: hypothetical protein AMXMBFR44_0390 [Candidatus Campbellbacteria bacterium]
MTQLQELTEKTKKVMEAYKRQYPDVLMDRDYFPFKMSEEFGECMQMYLMLTDRGRQKGKTKEEIKASFSEEIADLFGYLLVFADQEGVDLVKALDNKWFSFLDADKKESRS